MNKLLQLIVDYNIKLKINMKFAIIAALFAVASAAEEKCPDAVTVEAFKDKECATAAEEAD